MLYAGHVNYYNEYDNEVENCWFFVNAESYSHAMEKCIEHFGEEEMQEVTLESFSPYDFLEFWDGEDNVYKEAKAVAMEHSGW